MKDKVKKALQSFVFGFKTSDIPEVKKVIKEFGIGGLIFFSENIPDLEFVRDLIKQFQDVSEVPLFISIDQEGGTVRRIKEGITELPSMEDLGRDYSKEDVYGLSLKLAKDLLDLGFNMNLAPVLDVNFYPGEDSIVGTRSFGSDPNKVSEFGWQYAKGMMDGGVVPVGKHFPGHGVTLKDSHKVLPEVELDVLSLGKTLLPFKVAIERGIPGLMIGHIVIKDLCEDSLPATLSKSVLDQVKTGFSFSGFIMTDDLPMKGITDNFSIEEASILAMNIGCDLLLISGFLEDQYKAIELMIKEVENGRIPFDRIEDAYGRIINNKNFK